jgi:hypothetical protein
MNATPVLRIAARMTTAEPNPIEPLGSPEESEPMGPDPVHPLGVPDPDEPPDLDGVPATRPTEPDDRSAGF